MDATRFIGTLVLALVTVVPSAAWGQARRPGFTGLPVGATVAIMPADIELFSISGGGVLEPKADWTEAASKYFRTALLEKKQKLGLRTVEVAEKDADDFAEINTLHAAVAGAIAMHH